MVRWNIIFLSCFLLAGTAFVVSEILSRNVEEEAAPQRLGLAQKTKQSDHTDQLLTSAHNHSSGESEHRLKNASHTISPTELQSLIMQALQNGMSESGIRNFIDHFGEEKFKALVLASGRSNAGAGRDRAEKRALADSNSAPIFAKSSPSDEGL